MKIVMSYWTGPAMAETGDVVTARSGWAQPKANLASWCLSVLVAWQSYGNVHLVTDDLGRRVLCDELQLPFSSVSLELEGLPYNRQLWMAGKIATYAAQTEPFLHIDNDVYLRKPMPVRFMAADVVAQSAEFPCRFGAGMNVSSYEWFNIAYCRPRDYLRTKLKFPEWWNTYADLDAAYCMGIFGGNKIDFIQGYSREALALLEQCGPDLDTKMSLNPVLEQMTLYCYARHMGQRVTPLFLSDEKIYNSGLPAAIGYHHLMGGKRENMRNHRLFSRLKELFPEYHDRVVAL